MSRGCFVTGTDTGAGKTHVACAIVAGLRAMGSRVLPMKPVAAGTTQGRHGWANEDTLALLDAAGLDAAWLARVTPVLLREPMAPHLAAAREGRIIALAPLLEAYAELARQADHVVVEGAGGFRVPLNAREDASDLASALGLPVVLVVGMRLGCINHALLTRDAIAAKGLALAGWVANTIDPAMPVFRENVDALRERIDAPLLGVVPHAPGASALDVSRHLALDRLAA
jgi:dethiobiotin synthetase